MESWLDVEVDMCMLPCEDKANGRAEWRIETYCKNEKCIAKQEAWLERALTNCCKSKAKQARRAAIKQCKKDEDPDACEMEADEAYEASLAMCDDPTIL